MLSSIQLATRNCYGSIRNGGWWSGTHVVPEFTTQNGSECGSRCCENVDCKLWVWRSRDKMCHLKSDNSMRWHSSPNHFTAIKKNGKKSIATNEIVFSFIVSLTL